MHLPPAVKQLLTLRNPNSYTTPSITRLHAVLQRTVADARRRNAEKGWLVLATCTFLTSNVPSAVGHLYHFATRNDPNDPVSRRDAAEAVTKAAIIRESALKSTIFVGVPRTILALASLMAAAESDVKKTLRTESHRLDLRLLVADGLPGVSRTLTPENIESVLSRGQALWDSIYDPHAVKLYSKLGSYHPDFISFIIQSYGSVLAPLPDENEQGNLSRALGSVVGVACLRTEGGVGPQLTSHVFGLLKARTMDNLNEEDKWLSSDEGTEWVIRTVDTLSDAVRPLTKL
ncbi:hypothetical protein EW146_g3220 [Bondarzewia mesenterica]|uniref:Dol-P-Man:Man(5)GlcNAc(2)-PP-Dol alpha-1,3-mannosyltransferase n=1 Tax=Bondarzewia mesenterica TaxID=1095465 RepID=A0A4V3XFI2_9AGAM|nr:hypothetical protein EW146_g3220 [Bondarzewia mesenterica]